MGQKELNSNAFATRASAYLTERSTVVVALQNYSKLKQGGCTPLSTNHWIGLP